MSSEKIALVGAGAWGLNLLTHLTAHTFNIDRVSVRNRERFSAQLPSFPAEKMVSDPSELNPETDAVFLAVPDGKIAEAVNRLPEKVRNHALVVHSSGAMPISVLETARRGVCYPLQTFTYGRILKGEDLPFFIEASDSEGETFLTQVGQKISGKVRVMSSENRLQLHCGAVFACNFVNHCLRLAGEVAEPAGVDYQQYLSLLRETVEKLMDLPPSEAQTGPAVRGDEATIALHLNLLEQQANPEVAAVYRALTASIVKGIQRK